MKKPHSNTTTDSALGGDAREALGLVRALRADGSHPTHVTVGNVSIELAVVAGGPAPAGVATKPTTRTVIEEWGGPDFAKALSVEADIVDDEDQPAVRS